MWNDETTRSASEERIPVSSHPVDGYSPAPHPSNNSDDGGHVHPDNEDLLLPTVTTDDDQMIDILHHHPTSPSMILDDEDEEQQYVPESLRDFVFQVQTNLVRAKDSILAGTMVMDDAGGISFDSNDMSPRHGDPDIREDDADRQLKGDVLTRLDERRRRLAEQNRGNQVNNEKEEEEDEQQYLVEIAEDVSEQFWSPDLKSSPPPNPVASITDSQIKREATAALLSPPYQYVQPSPSAKIGEVPTEQTKEHQPCTNRDSGNGRPIVTDIPPSFEKDSVSHPSTLDVAVSSMQETGRSPHFETMPPTQSDVMTLVTSLQLEEPEMEIEFGDPDDEYAHQQEDSFMEMQDPMEHDVQPRDARAWSAIPSPDRSAITHIGDLDETCYPMASQMSEVIPDNVVLPSPLTPSSPKPLDPTSTSRAKSVTSHSELLSSPSRSPDRARSIRRTLNITKKRNTTTTAATTSTNAKPTRESTLHRSRPLAVKTKQSQITATTERKKSPVPSSTARVETKSSKKNNFLSPSSEVENRKVNVNTSSSIDRLMRNTVASLARTTASLEQVSPTETIKSPVTVEEAMMKAKERVRTRLLKEKQSSLAPGQTPRNVSTVDEKIARARERARMRQLEKEAAARAAIRSNPLGTGRSSGSQTITKSSAISTVSTVIASERKPLSVSTALKSHKLTVPKTPNFATTAKLGERKPPPPAPISMANSTQVLMKGLRQDLSLSTPKVKLAYVHAPHFATTDRYGEKVVTPGGSSFVTLAQSTTILMNELRRESTPYSPSHRQRMGVTVPISPKFHTSTRRTLPKSAAEQEEEMMKEFNSHPFKAAPIMASDQTKPLQKALVRRKVTTPIPFTLRTDVRGADAKPIPRCPSKEEEDLHVMNEFRFQARPVPNFSKPLKLPALGPTKVKATTTEFKPFHLSTSTRITKEKTADDHNDDETAVFRARPLPKSTYAYRAPVKTESAERHPYTSPEFHPPKLSTGDRSEKRKAVEEASRRRSEQLKLERKQKLKDIQEGKLKEAMKKADLLSPRSRKATECEPFSLESDVRHERYMKDMEQKLREDDEIRQRQMEFHARPFKASPPSLKASPQGEQCAHP